MTDYAELVKRLRHGLVFLGGEQKPDPVANEAADAIEQLVAERALPYWKK